MSQALSVSQLVKQIKTVIEQAPQLDQISCVGEVSNLTKSKNGHWYFSIKDAFAKINCVMFYGQTLKLKTPFKAGDEVEIKGKVTLYPATGQVQVVVESVSLAGQGALYIKYLELRSQFHKAGYFNQEHKKELVKYPESIGVIVGEKSAAMADISKTLTHRWPMAEVTYYPSLVQGVLAPADLIKNLSRADQAHHDVIIIGRGGGSLEDLWAFNDPELVLAIFNANTPIITGVGHEIDVTLVDYVADLRALTPTDGAVKATPNQWEILQNLKSQSSALSTKVHQQLQAYKYDINHLIKGSKLQRPMLMFMDKQMQIQMLEDKINRIPNNIKFQSSQFKWLFSELNAKIKRNAHKELTQLQLKEQALSKQLEDKVFVYQQKMTRLMDKQTKQVLSFKHSIESKATTVINQQSQLAKTMSQRLENQQHDLTNKKQVLQVLSPYGLLEKGYVLTFQDDKVIKDRTSINPKKPITIQYRDGKVESTIKEK